jgi:hypothetical protein
MFVLGWHAPAHAAVQKIREDGLTVVTVEDVLRSGGGLLLSQVLPPAYAGLGGSFNYQATPQGGPYCFYRHRPGEETPPYPDCPDITTHARRHATLLVEAGIDYVVMDATNLHVLDGFSDAIQLRPFEVLAEEWSALRRAGVRTPDLAIWQSVPTGANLQERFLDVYNHPDHDRLVPRDPRTGKKVFFYVDPPDHGRFPDPALLASIASNGGRDDVVTVPMWAYYDHVGPMIGQRGVWQFMSPCLTDGEYSTNLDDGPCDQPWTPASVVGSVVTVSPAYQLYFASTPFGTTGKRGGLTLRKQFERALSVQPDWLFISSWNEQVAQPYDQGHGIRSMGLEEDPSAGTLGFVDTYGVEYSRDMEPTEQDGTWLYDLLRSCIRVFRAGVTTCSIPTEPCCQGGNTSDNYVHVYSLAYGDNTDSGSGHVTVTTHAEVQQFLDQGWREVCAHGPNRGPFCARVDEPDPHGGPFILYARPGAGRQPLFRCELEPRHHFMTTDPDCEILHRPGALLGHLSTWKGGETLRPLWRCYSEVFRHAHSLTGTCTDANREAVLGYVR